MSAIAHRNIVRFITCWLETEEMEDLEAELDKIDLPRTRSKSESEMQLSHHDLSRIDFEESRATALKENVIENMAQGNNFDFEICFGGEDALTGFNETKSSGRSLKQDVSGIIGKSGEDLEDEDDDDSSSSSSSSESLENDDNEIDEEESEMDIAKNNLHEMSIPERSKRPRRKASQRSSKTFYLYI